MSEEFGLIINNEHSLTENVHIDWNKDELLKYVRSITEKYNGRVYTDDDMDSAPIERDAPGEDERQDDYQYENGQ